MSSFLCCRLDDHTSEQTSGKGSSAGRETAAAHMAALRELLITHIGKLGAAESKVTPHKTLCGLLRRTMHAGLHAL
jgi:hypothetical protein